jgi:hypothetical protein
MTEKSAIVRATFAFYDLLESQAEIESMLGHDIKVFRGPLVVAYNSLGFSNSYYTAVRRNLINAGAIEILEKGAANRHSTVAIIRRPEESELSSKKDLTRRVEPAILAGQIEGIKRQLGGVDIVELMTKVDDLDKRLRKVENGTKS